MIEVPLKQQEAVLAMNPRIDGGVIELTGCIAQGSRGIVYEANWQPDEEPLRRVAVKIEQVEGARAFYQQQAGLMSLIGKHPNVAEVLHYGMDEEDGERFITLMPYYDGGSLEQWAGTDEEHLPRIVHCIAKIASGLEHAHHFRIVHRDVKPDNMLFDTSGSVVLSDFGIAIPEIPIAPSEYNSRAYGPPAYKSPEHWQGNPNKYSDQYSLGISVYQLLTGFLPFNGDPSELRRAHLEQLPPTFEERTNKVNSPLHDVLWPIVQKALAKDYTNRFTSVTAFSEAMEDAIYPLLSDSQKTLFPGVVKRAQARLSIREARIAAKSGRYVEAQQQYDQAIAQNPTYMTAYYELAHILQAARRSQESIKDIFMEVYQCPTRELSDYVRKGYALAQLGHHAEALMEFEEAISRGYTNPLVYEYKVVSLEAAADLERASSHKEEARYLYQLALALCGKLIMVKPLGPNVEDLQSKKRAIFNKIGWLGLFMHNPPQGMPF